MSNTTEKIAQFLKDHQIAGKMEEVPVHDYVHAHGENRCFTLKLQWVALLSGIIRSDALYVYVGQYAPDPTLAEAIWLLLESADQYGGWTTYERWNHENDEGYYEQELGRNASVNYYVYVRECYNSLVYVLGEECYEELSLLLRSA